MIECILGREWKQVCSVYILSPKPLQSLVPADRKLIKYSVGLSERSSKNLYHGQEATGGCSMLQSLPDRQLVVVSHILT